MTEGNWLLTKGTFAIREGAKWWWLLNMLDEDAEKRTIYGVVNTQKELQNKFYSRLYLNLGDR
jgi:hypothetical protein